MSRRKLVSWKARPERAGRRLGRRAESARAPAASSPRSPPPSPPCSRSRSSQVSYEVVVRSIAIAPKKRSKHSGSMPQLITVCTTAASTGSSLRPSTSAVRKRSAKPASRARLTSPARAAVDGRVRVVDDVVGQPAEGVDRVDVLALPPAAAAPRPRSTWCRTARSAGRSAGSPRSARQSGRSVASAGLRQVVGPPLGGHELAGDQHHRYADARARFPSRRRTVPGSRRSTFAGRNGPVWANVWASANGVPAAMP